MSNFYCSAIHRNIRITGSTETGVRLLPCCIYRTDKIYSTLEQYENSEEIRELKQATDWVPGCEICRRQESMGQRSYRMDSNNFWQGEKSGIRVEVFPANVCNLKCLMCDSSVSTAHAQERHAIGEGSYEYIKEFDITNESMDIISNLDNVSYISLIGGEFFLTKRNLEFLDFIIERNIGLRVVTNATVLLPAHLNKLKQIADLELQISIDGIEDSYEFMRYPADWATFSANATELTKQFKASKLNFHVVAQPLNVQYIIPTLDWINRKGVPSRITNLVFPVNMSWNILKPVEKQLAVDLLQSQLAGVYRLTAQQRSFVEDLCITINTNPYSMQHRNQFINLFAKTMSHRKISPERIKQHLGELHTLTTI